MITLPVPHSLLAVRRPPRPVSQCTAERSRTRQSAGADPTSTGRYSARHQTTRAQAERQKGDDMTDSELEAIVDTMLNNNTIPQPNCGPRKTARSQCTCAAIPVTAVTIVQSHLSHSRGSAARQSLSVPDEGPGKPVSGRPRHAPERELSVFPAKRRPLFPAPPPKLP